ncbi:DUF3095 domain-containing protein [Gayadomonas joobiniege]|uniref:DUF3095 domain-containing protein n=1 Tax=Gayadomonas joobiniege TaxID=1234606 RepID=UPI00036EC945|nr:DUF3095 domain-containing protein [Gayadomonas joobiniege]
MTSPNFYKELVSFKNFEDFSNASHYRVLPDSWYIAVADIKNSTAAIAAGKYRAVNAIGVATIVAVHNKCDGYELPYIFAGDGASIAFPYNLLQAVKEALVSAQGLAKNEFSLELMIGIVPVSSVLKQGYQISVAKFQASEDYCQAMFSGGGLDYAERLVKQQARQGTSDANFVIDEQSMLQTNCFDGFECRWNRIKSPHEEVIALLVKVRAEHDANVVYSELNEAISRTYGDDNNHHPLREDALRLTLSLQRLYLEGHIKSAHQKWFIRFLHLCKLLCISLFGRLLMASGITAFGCDWSKYKKRLMLNTDFKKYDDVLRMVISGTKSQRLALLKALQSLHEQRKIYYGLSVSDASIITCFITDYGQDHIHFLDLDKGGYALAAKALKEQMQSNN